MKIFLKPFFYEQTFEDIDLTKKINKIFINKRDFVFKIPKPNEPVILCVSGGLDSISLWYLLLKKYQLNVYPINFSNNFLSKERKSVFYFSKYFKKKYPNLFHKPKIVNLKTNFNLSNKKIINSYFYKHPSLILKNLSIYKKTNRKELIFHNNIFRINDYVIASYRYALELINENINVKTIILGLMPEDGLTSRESTLATLRSLNIYLCSVLGDWNWQLGAPIDIDNNFFYRKNQLLKLVSKNIPLEKTWSCHSNFIFHCGLCKGCLSRKMFLNSANIKDRAIYLSDFLIFKKLLKLSKFFFNLYKNFYFNFPLKKIARFEYTKFENYLFNLSKDIFLDYDKEIGYLVFDKKIGKILKTNEQGYSILKFIKNSNNGVLGKKILINIAKDYPNENREKIKKDIFKFLNKLIKLKFNIIFR